MYAIVILVGGKGSRVSKLLKGKSKPEIEILPNIKIVDFQIKNFIMFYERLTKHMLKTLSSKANSVIRIDNKHRLKSIKFH